jgi:FKBP12-rapamycin complex-associated protein
MVKKNVKSDLELKYPFQALIYPLTVASKSNVTARQVSANKVLKSMREHSNTLVQQAMLVGIFKIVYVSEGLMFNTK